MLEVWVTSQSGVMKTVLDGIAAFFNQNGGELLLYLVTVMGFLVILFKYIIGQPNFRQIFLWFLVVTMIPVILMALLRFLLVTIRACDIRLNPRSIFEKVTQF